MKQLSRWCVYDWLERTELVPKKRPWKMKLEALAAHVAAYPDAYQHERAEALGVSRYAIWYGLRRLALKKTFRYLEKYRRRRRKA